MPKRNDDALIDQLALHVAMGGFIRPWAQRHGQDYRAVRRWQERPKFKELVRKHQHTITDRVLGRHIGLLTKAIAVQKELLDDESVNVRQRASEYLLSTLRNTAELAKIREEFEAFRREQSQSKGGTA